MCLILLNVNEDVTFTNPMHGSARSHTTSEDALFFERESLITHQKLQRILSAESILTSQDSHAQEQSLSFLDGMLSLLGPFKTSLCSLSHTHTHTHKPNTYAVSRYGKGEPRRT